MARARSSSGSRTRTRSTRRSGDNRQGNGFESRASRGTMTRCRDKRGAFVACEDRGARLGFARPDEIRTRGPSKRSNRAGSSSRGRMFVIRRDGREVARVPDEEVLRWFHRNVPYSMDHATRYEGYSVEPAGRGGGSRNRNEGRVKRNPEGMSWAEWLRAAGVSEDDLSFENMPADRLRMLRGAWESGEDPSEYRAALSARRGRRDGSRRNRQSGGGSCGCS